MLFRSLDPGESLLLGTDLVKDLERVVSAYDDSQGVTAEFVRNSLRVTTDSSLSRNLARMEVALRGYIGDGLLVRVSEITSRDDAFALQARFLTDFLGALTPVQRELYIGASLPPMPHQP